MADLKLAGQSRNEQYQYHLQGARNSREGMEKWAEHASTWCEHQIEIRDRRLWEEEFDSYTAYCTVECQLSPSYVSRKLLAYLMPGDDSERVKRETRRLENAGEPAAEPAGEPINESAGLPDIAAVLDARGVPVTEERFQRIFAHSDRFGSIMRSLKSLKKEISDLDSMPAGEVLHEQIQAIERDRRNIYSAVKFSKPWAVCPYCGGSASHSECGGCKGRGWVTKEVFDQSPAT